MPAPRKTAPAPIYKQLVDERAPGERTRRTSRDCTVIAVAAVTGVSYAEAHTALAAAGRREGHGASFTVTERALNSLGFVARRWTSAEVVAFLWSYPKKGIAGITTHQPARFPKQWAGTGRLLLRSTGHISAVIDGHLADWAAGRALRVHSVFTIEKKEG